MGDGDDYEQALMRLLPRITDRDRRILVGLWEHRVMTTHHLHRIFFPHAGGRRARYRLLALHRYGLIDRFRRHTHDRNAPDHWVLAPTGAALVALHRGEDPLPLGHHRHDRALALAYAPNLPHILGLAETRAALYEAAREAGAEVVRWVGERASARRWNDYAVRPDAHLRWRQHGRTLDAFLEYDTGTENLNQVQWKMPGYRRLADATDRPVVVLFLFHSQQREDNAARKLAEYCTGTLGVYMSTYTRLYTLGAAEPIWRLAHCRDRAPLGEISRAYPQQVRRQVE